MPEVAEKPVSQYLPVESFPLVTAGIVEQDELYDSLQLTAASIEELLELPEYAAIEKVELPKLSKSQKREVDSVEKQASFSPALGSTFELLLETLERLPTQKEFAEKATEQSKECWQHSNSGQKWTEVMNIAVYNRHLRSYSSHVVELHTLLSIRELFPEWNVYCSNELDLLMGVDLVIETEKKRLYVHVFKNSKMGFVSFQRKQFRGGKRNSHGKFIKYQRDFSGDKSLQYDWNRNQQSESTQFINGNPLLRQEYLETHLMMFDRLQQIGCPLADVSKLQYLEEYLQKTQ